MVSFSLSVQFARESDMLKLPEERRRWGKSKGAGSGRGERRENAVFFSPLPLPPFLLSRSHLPLRVTISTPAPIFHCHKIKVGGYNNITNTNKVSPTQNTSAVQARFMIVYAFEEADF